MLVTGTPGSGRARLARDIAALANDIAPDEAARHPDIHQIEPGFRSRFQGSRKRHLALLLAVLVNEQNAGRADFIVDTGSILHGRGGHGASYVGLSC